VEIARAMERGKASLCCERVVGIRVGSEALKSGEGLK